MARWILEIAAAPDDDADGVWIVGPVDVDAA
jgi:hypothetical protein